MKGVIMTFIDEYFDLVVQSPEIERRKLIVWIIWVVLATITFTKLTTGEFINFEYRIILFIAIGLLLSLKIFSQRYEELLVINIQKLLLFLYLPNIALILIKELTAIAALVVCRADLPIESVANQCIFIAFWLLSIPMVLIRKQAYCLINMLLIVVIIIFFDLILNNCIWQLSNTSTLMVSSLLVIGSLLLGVLQSIRRLSVMIRQS